jgi:hypothetical protein
VTSTPYAAFTPVQAAVYSALTGSGTLVATLGGPHVYDGEAPEGSARPYILIGESLETPDNAHGAFGRQTVMTLHVWSDYQGFTEANAIAYQVQELLDEQPLNIVGARHVLTRFEFAQTLTDPDDRSLRHATLRFRFITCKE